MEDTPSSLRSNLLRALAVIAVALPLTSGTSSAQEGHSWDFNILSFVQRVQIDERDPLQNAGLGLNVGFNLPSHRAFIVSPYFGVAMDASIGAKSDEDIAFSSADLGLQVLTRNTWLGTALVVRAARGLRNTAEMQAAPVLTNFSGTGFTAAIGLRRRISRVGALELSATRLSGRFNNAQIENLLNFSHTDETPVSRNYSVWRFGLSFAF